MWEALINIIMAAGAAAANSSIVYLSKKKPVEFDGKKFTRSVGVATVVGALLSVNPSIPAVNLVVLSVYGGFFIEKLYLLVKRKMEEKNIVIKLG